MNNYLAMQERHQNEVNNFPMAFAFSQSQLEEGMKKLGLNPSDTDKVYGIGGGGFYRKSDNKAFHEMFEHHDREMKEAIQQDKTGDGFIFEMFDYELGNHEYTYTNDVSQTLDSLGLTVEDINNDPRMIHGLQRACKEQKEWSRTHD